MKKVLALLLSVLIIVSGIVLLVSCDNGKTPDATTEVTTTAAETEATTVMTTVVTTVATTEATTEPTTAQTTTASTPIVDPDEYAYINEAVGLKLKLPDSCVVATTSPFMVYDYSTGNNFNIVEQPREGYSRAEFASALAQQMPLVYSQLGYTDITIGGTVETKLGNLDSTVLILAVTVNGVPMEQYMYLIENGDSMISITLTIVDDTPPSVYEAMFS